MSNSNDTFNNDFNVSSPASPIKIRNYPQLFSRIDPILINKQPTDAPSYSLSSSLVAAIASVGFVIIVLFTTLAIRRYRHLPSNNKKQDCEFVYEEEEEPLKPVNIVEGLDFEMQILQESDKLTNRKEKLLFQEEKAPEISIVIDDDSNSSALPNTPNKNLITVEHDSASTERPKSLKFLAASIAFQNSTVKAVERLPYTPDPDCSVCELDESLPSTVNCESKDKLTPLTQPKFAKKKMKARGLLERRGSNVALTISLKSNGKNNAENGVPVNTKSPKPLAYLQKASSSLLPEELHSKSCDTLKLQQEFWEIPMNHPSDKDFNIPGHGTKNRYRTILPNEHSRVKLICEPSDDSLSTYINANYIRDCADIPVAEGSDARGSEVCSPVTRKTATFIATQGPMANTINDFWRMVWQDECASVVMITKLKERKEKCAQYLPINVDDEMKFNIDICVRVVAMRKYEHFTVRQLDVTRGKEKRTIRHFWYTTWMDHETPEKTRGLLELVQEVSLWNKPTHGPVVVHCSAGIGRTGCYIAVTFGCQQLMKTGKTDILRLVSQMRLDRGGMIQTWEQYQFVHQALSRYGRILAGENVTTPSTCGSIRSPPDRSIRTSTNQETVPSTTPQSRRSQSETKLTPPSESKLNFNYPAVEIEKADALSPGKMGISINGSAPSSPPHISLSSNENVSMSGADKPLSSPSIHSPLSRMCLQAKDMNVNPTTPTIKLPHFDKKSKLDNNDSCIKTNSDANRSPTNHQLSNPDKVSRVSPKYPKTTSRNPPLFSFDLPPSVSNGDHDADLSPVQPNKQKDAIKNESCYFFPGVSDR